MTTFPPREIFGNSYRFGHFERFENLEFFWSLSWDGVSTDAASSETLYPVEVTGHPGEVFHDYMMI